MVAVDVAAIEVSMMVMVTIMSGAVRAVGRSSDRCHRSPRGVTTVVAVSNVDSRECDRSSRSIALRICRDAWLLAVVRVDLDRGNLEVGVLEG